MKATLSYFPDIQTLIVKIPSQAHEKAHEKLRQLILLESIAPPMNLALSTFALMGSTMLKGKNGSFRETVAAWKNANIRSREGDFLRLVVQAGWPWVGFAVMQNGWSRTQLESQCRLDYPDLQRNEDASYWEVHAKVRQHERGLLLLLWLIVRLPRLLWQVRLWYWSSTEYSIVNQIRHWRRTSCSLCKTCRIGKTSSGLAFELGELECLRSFYKADTYDHKEWKIGLDMALPIEFIAQRSTIMLANFAQLARCTQHKEAHSLYIHFYGKLNLSPVERALNKSTENPGPTPSQNSITKAAHTTEQWYDEMGLGGSVLWKTKRNGPQMSLLF